MKPRRFPRRSVGLIVALLFLAAMGGVALAKTPAGTEISNQAFAEYVDSGNAPRTATSNIVIVTVQQVAGVEVSPGGAVNPIVQVVPGQLVQYAFAVENTGNGVDNFKLKLDALTGEDHPDAIDPETLQLYHDVNNNGVIDAGDTLIGPDESVGPVAAGDLVHLIARARVPADADPEGNEAIKIQLTATSHVDEGVSGQSTIVTFKIVKEGVLSATLSAQSDDADDRTRVEPGGYIDYTLTIINQGATAVNGAQLTLGIPGQTTFRPGSLKVNGGAVVPDPEDWPYTLILPNLAGGLSHIIEYRVDVDEDALVGFITNQASVQVGENPPVSTNQVQTRVRHMADVVLDENGGVYEVDPTEIGKTYPFPYTVTNNANGPDTIFIAATIDNSWAVIVYAADGVTELPKVDGKYTVGSLAKGASANFVVKVTVPTNEPTDPDAEYVLTVIASSVAGTTDTEQKTATLKNVKGAGVKLAIVGADEKSGNPGATVEYEVEVENLGPAQDLFDLSALNVPAGYSVGFFDSDGNPISNITVPGYGKKSIKVRVTVPASSDPADPVAFSIRARSQNNNNEEATIPLKIGVNEVVSISIAPNRTGAAGRNAWTSYTLTVRNLGNSPQEITLSFVDLPSKKLQYSFTSDNVVDGKISLAKGASANITVRVDVPSEIAVGTEESMVVRAAAGGVTDSATLTTTVTGGELHLDKDADKAEAKPGEVITYTITAENISVGELTEVVIFEKIPQHTEFVAATTAAGATVQYSTNHGTTWHDYDPEEPPADPAAITDVKWELEGGLPSLESLVVTLTVRVK